MYYEIARLSKKTETAVLHYNSSCKYFFLWMAYYTPFDSLTFLHTVYVRVDYLKIIVCKCYIVASSRNVRSLYVQDLTDSFFFYLTCSLIVENYVFTTFRNHLYALNCITNNAYLILVDFSSDAIFTSSFHLEIDKTTNCFTTLKTFWLFTI